MTTTTLQNVFGANASQDLNYLHIDKTQLLTLVTSADNSAGSLLAAIIATAQQTYEGLIVDSSGYVLADSSGYALGYDSSDSFTDLSVNFFDWYLPTGEIDWCFLINFKKAYVNTVS